MDDKTAADSIVELFLKEVLCYKKNVAQLNRRGDRIPLRESHIIMAGLCGDLVAKYPTIDPETRELERDYRSR